MMQALIRPSSIDMAFSKKFGGSLAGVTQKSVMRCATELKTYTRGKWITLLTNEKTEQVGTILDGKC